MIRVSLPYQLQKLAGVGQEISLNVSGPATIAVVVDAIERDYPMLTGTIRDPLTRRRRPMLRFFACSNDVSDIGMDTPLPADISEGKDVLIVLGAIAGG